MLVQMVLLMLLMTTESGEASWLIPKKKTVNITNDLGADMDLKVHCKSKDDDLGQKLLTYKGYFSFRFRPNAWGTTRFYCLMSWEQVSHWFDIYLDIRDADRCVVCVWSIQTTGPCMLNDKTHHFDICFPWNP
ncbi:hypothetical protein P3X46_006384 [Hevea brasiliensis]|uniref:S-protein homolog n=1 Tax=Hevea brasiliensis TaxID=3981 RepID=A0ABQ9MSL1_HEVBR|nr:hypothetical protein P3X46_006384 [Hevea brasiliensis]